MKRAVAIAITCAGFIATPYIHAQRVRPTTTSAPSDQTEELNRLRLLGTKAIPELVSHLGEASDEQARPFMDALAALDVQAAPALAAALKDQDGRKRWRAAIVLGCRPAAALAAQDALINAADDPSVQVDTAALNALICINRDGARQRAAVFAAHLHHQDPAACQAACRGLISVGAEAKVALPDLIQDLQVGGKGEGPDHDQYPHVDRVRQFNALRVIGNLGPEAESAIPSVIKVLCGGGGAGQSEWDANPQLLAGRTLARIGPTAASPMIDALDPTRFQQFIAACGAIEDWGPPAVITVAELASGLGDNNSYIVDARLRALAAIGPAAKSALPALNGPKAKVATGASKLLEIAIERVGGAAPTPPPGGYSGKRFVPADTADIALVRHMLDAAAAQDIRLGPPAQIPQMRGTLAGYYARIGDFERACTVAGEYVGDENLYLALAALARVRAGDSDSAARYFDRARMLLVSTRPGNEVGYPADADLYARLMFMVGDTRRLDELTRWPEVSESIVEAFLDAGKLAEARQFLRHRSNNPAIPQVGFELAERVARAFITNGDKTSAMEVYGDLLADPSLGYMPQEQGIELADGIIAAGGANAAIQKVAGIVNHDVRDRVLRDMTGVFAIAGDVERAAKCAGMIDRPASATQPAFDNYALDADADVAAARAGKIPTLRADAVATLVRGGQLKQAIAMARDPQASQEFQTQVALQCAKAGDFATAAAVLPSEIRAGDESFSEAVRTIVESAAAKGRIADAEKVAAKVSRHIPAGAYRIMAISLARAGDKAGAASLMNKAEAVRDASTGAPLLLERAQNALALARIGDSAGAIDAVQKLRDQPFTPSVEYRRPQFLSFLALALIEAGQGDAAWQWCQSLTDPNERGWVMQKMIETLLNRACPVPPPSIRYQRRVLWNIWAMS